MEDNPALPPLSTLTELFRLHRTPFLARRHDTRKLWQIAGFGPNGNYVIGWIVGYENPEIMKLDFKERAWLFISYVGMER